jgi:acetate kinase
LAFDVFCYRIKKYIGAYAAAMGGVDSVIFTGGIGENSPDVRKAVCENMGFLGIEIDKAINSNKEKEKSISAAKSSVGVFVIPTNEELMIAMETKEVVKKKK